VVRISITFVLAAALALDLVGSAKAAAPRLIMVSGESLAEPILLDDADDIFALYQSFFFDGDPVGRTRLEGRSALRLALFWNNVLWEPYVRDGRLAELKPLDANQFGRLYPAERGEPALVHLPGYGKWPKTVGETAHRILDAHGVPVRLDEEDGGLLPSIAAVAVASLLALTLVLAVSALLAIESLGVAEHDGGIRRLRRPDDSPRLGIDDSERRAVVAADGNFDRPIPLEGQVLDAMFYVLSGQTSMPRDGEMFALYYAVRDERRREHGV